MNDDNNNLNEEIISAKKNDRAWLKPVLIFYVKTTSWIIFPLLLGVLGGQYVSKSVGSQVLFFVFIMLGFLITCLGIYREIKQYKKDLNKNESK
jgi:F0F1-type ATP synthase assembly protein I